MKINSMFDAAAHAERVRNMLQIFEEHIESEVSFLEKSDNEYAKYFASRYDLLRSQMDMIQFAVQDISDCLNSLTKEGAA